MSNADRFLEAFNAIENYLRRSQDSKTYMSYFGLLDYAAEHNVVVRQFNDQLRLFGNLRNAIAHSNRKDGKPVADPREDAVEEIERIAGFLLNPPKVGDHFLKEVYCVSPEDSLKSVLENLVEKDFSQAPVVKDGFILGLIDFESIARWVVSKMKEEGEVFDKFLDACIKDAVNLSVKLKNFRVIKRDTDFVTAREYYVASLSNPHPAQALLITESGRRDEPIIGIITISEDLEKIIAYLRK